MAGGLILGVHNRLVLSCCFESFLECLHQLGKSWCPILQGKASQVFGRFVGPIHAPILVFGAPVDPEPVWSDPRGRLSTARLRRRWFARRRWSRRNHP